MCAAKPLFRQGKSGVGVQGLGERMRHSGPAKKVSRTGPRLPVELDGQGGPESFKGRRRACAPRHIPDRVPVTAGIRSETAMRPLDSARFSRRDVAAADGIAAGAVIAVLALGLAGLLAAFFFFLDFFFAAFFFLPATLLDAFFLDDFFLPDAFFFFFFLPPFFAFFFAISISLEVAKESPAEGARTIQTPGGCPAH